ncbi:Protein POLAR LOCALIZATION DURING ASYMMETRIC DIVISION AND REDISTRIBUTION like [Actinidia chinensis var. chinensis]|uniref:Protein POLAR LOCALIZATION DURING ASYMMETRIC DIVISION AND REDISTRIBUTION like n=1 Tax=Actinidia chinensis var. chinensis TaxID=1590841 RepID=A0A2R6QZB2_ACTCC|nr:Protein POLAR LOCALIZATION DURING ASYMMETRIC DIVISION AND REDISTRIBUTION like [Actinidia chinensis var. chinensis]
MRIADILISGDDDFSGDGAPLPRKPRRSRDNVAILECSWQISRWFSLGKRSKGRGSVVKIEEVEREAGMEGSDGAVGGERKEVGCSMNGVNGESSSCESKGLMGDSELSEISGQYRKEDLFNLAVGFGLFYFIAATKNELDKTMELRTQMEMLLQNVKEEFANQKREILPMQSESNDLAYSTTDAPESLCTNGNVSLRNRVLFKNQPDSEPIVLCDQSQTCEATRQEKCVEGIAQLEAELEAELERLQIHLDSKNKLDFPKQQIMEVTVDDTAPIRSLDASLGKVVDPPEAGEEHSGVPPNELERRLHELIESRQEERIKELEAALDCANQMLLEKEREVFWWKDAAQHITNRVPKTSSLSR